MKSACVSHQCGKDQAAAENGHLDEITSKLHKHIHMWGEIQNNRYFHSCQLVAQNVTGKTYSDILAEV